MGKNCMYGLTVVFLAFAGMASAQCPAFVRKANICQYVDSPGVKLPVTGTVVCGTEYGTGLYTAPLGTATPTLIPNTQGMGVNSTQITEDGQWVLFNSGGPKLIRIDGQYKTSVPVTADNSEGCCTFWWNAPSGSMEVVYKASSSNIHAIPVTFSANANPTFGIDRSIANIGSNTEFTMGCAGNHLFLRVDDAHYGPKMVTLPATGAATAADFYVPANNDYPSWGCKCTISHDGRICCFNPGYDQFPCCIADEGYLLRHKSFVLLPFQEKTAPAVGWQAVLLKQKAISISWAPRKYLFLSATDTCKGASAGTSNFWSDFKSWCYTNDTSYIVGDLSALPYNGGGKDSSAHANNPDSGTIWLVHYPTNTWTRILKPMTPVGRGTLLAFPAVWICKTCPVNTITPLHGNHLEYRGVPSKGSFMVDIRGRRIESISAAAPKLTAGVYYTVDRDGVMKRVVVGR